MSRKHVWVQRLLIAWLGRSRGHLSTLDAMALTDAGWRRAAELPAPFEVFIWEHLVLDARALPPHVGATVSLANAALGAFIATRLELLKSKVTPSGLWEWINDRGNCLKEPSVADNSTSYLCLLEVRR